MNQESTNVEATNTEQTSAQSEINQAATLLKGVNVKKHALDITSLVLVAVLFAAGCILDFTVAKSLSIGNIQPEFVMHRSACLFCLFVQMLFKVRLLALWLLL